MSAKGRMTVWGCKLMLVKKEQRVSCEKMRMSGEEMQEVDKFNYLKVISADGGVGGRSGSQGA